MLPWLYVIATPRNTNDGSAAPSGCDRQELFRRSAGRRTYGQADHEKMNERMNRQKKGENGKIEVYESRSLPSEVLRSPERHSNLIRRKFSPDLFSCTIQTWGLPISHKAVIKSLKIRPQ